MTQAEFDALVGKYARSTEEEARAAALLKAPSRDLSIKTQLALYTLREGTPLAALRPKLRPSAADIPILALWEFYRTRYGQDVADAKLDALLTYKPATAQ